MTGKYQRSTVSEDRRYRRGWKRLRAVLSLLVVVSTLSALVLPAVTMSQNVCTLAEHQHTPECYTSGGSVSLACTYETLGVHSHTEECRNEKGTLTCTVTDFLVHTHGDPCYQEGTLVCALPEIKEHQHGDACYQVPAADPGHTHTDDCYEWANACTLEETSGHAHGEGCYAVGGEQVCTLEEAAGHAHGEGCYYAGGEQLCTQEEAEAHIHETACFAEDGSQTCPLAETEGHTHGEGCFAAAGALLCTQAESEGHAHGEGCFAAAGTLLCTQAEVAAHTHEEACAVKVKGALICTQQEREAVPADAAPELICKEKVVILHTHGDDCYITEAETNETTESWILELFRQQPEDSEEEFKVLVCTQPEVFSHTHEESCFAEQEPQLTCQLPEHTHTIECRPVEEEPLTAEDVVALIGELPALQEVDANLAAMTGEELAAYQAKLTTQINAALAGYNGLSEDNKTLVTNYTKLADYAYLVAEDTAVREVGGKISHLPTLAEFQAQYDALAEADRPAYVQGLADQISRINGLHNALNSEQKSLVLNYTKLMRLEAYLNNLDPAAPEASPEPAPAEGSLEFVAEGFTTTVTASDAANLPADTVITATPLFDSNEDLTASPFSLFDLFDAPEEEETQGQDGSMYLEQIMAAITWGEVTRVKLFDITLTSGEEAVQPAAGVQVRTEFAEPMYVEENEFIYGVHIGGNGQVDILPATTERDEDGNIVAITHTQSSFSPTGYVYVLEHTVNTTDITDQVLPVHYCIWVNDQWIIAGSTRYGWYGDYTSAADWTTDKRDYITIDKIKSVLGPYGFLEGVELVPEDAAANAEAFTEIKEDIWYQRAEDQGMTIRHDTTPQWKEVTVKENGENVTKSTWIFPLSGNKVKDDGYHIYYVPQGTISGKEKVEGSTYARNRDLADDLKQQSKFYTMTVRDMNNLVYSLEEENNKEIFPQAQVVRYGEPVEVKVRPNDKSGTNMSWMWVNDQGHTVHGIDRLYDSDHDGVFEDKEADPRFHYTYVKAETETDPETGEEVIKTPAYEIYRFGLTKAEADKLNAEGSRNNGELWTATGILGRTTLIPYSRAVTGAEQTTDKQVDVAVYLDGQWQKVGQLNLMYRRKDICLETNANGTSGAPRWFITAGQIYSILKPFGFTDPVGDNDITKEGFTFAHAEEAFNAENPGAMTLHADGVLQKLEYTTTTTTTTTVAVGITSEDSIKNMTLFYLPGSGVDGTAEIKEDIHGKTLEEYTVAKKDGTTPLIQGDGFYSITVKDEYQLIYYGYEVDNFKVYIPEGQPAEVKVENNEDVLWSIRQPWVSEKGDESAKTEYSINSEGNFNHYSFRAVNGPLSIEASHRDPQFIVQYYTDLERYRLFGSENPVDEEGNPIKDKNGKDIKTLALIDTSAKEGAAPGSGGNMPTNKDISNNRNTMDLKYLGIQGTGSYSGSGANGQNAGSSTEYNEVLTYTDRTAIYNQESYDYVTHRTWEAIDKLRSNKDYRISSISILKDGHDPASEEEDDFWIYMCEGDGDNISFTNLASEEYAPRVEKDGKTVKQPAKDENGNVIHYRILVTEGMILRLHYTRENRTTTYNANFYDYDISSGQTNNRYSVGQKGINSYWTKADTANKYAFGNDNCFTGMASAEWNNQKLNQYNRDKDANGKTTREVYRGCTFELVQDIDIDGSITWGEGISGPDIFGTESATGKKVYTGNLTFDHVGDVHTLTATTVKNGNSSYTRGNLDQFFHPSPTSGVIYDGVNNTYKSNILTNNFWAMDGVTNTDAHWGAGNGETRGKASGYANGSAENTRGDEDTGNFPQSDDGKAHNWFFGMNFAVGFSLSQDYIGPMEYIFFGDDDMWVFLEKVENNEVVDRDLICDIGGVHSAVGEYVNLRDWLPNGTSGNYNLRFYYTERGASGSTCWMSFTLPNSTSYTVEEGTSSISLSKELQNLEGDTIVNNDQYYFKLSLYEDSTRQVPLNKGLAITITRATGEIDFFSIESGNTFNVGPGEKMLIEGAPIGKYYVLEELPDDRFNVEVNGDSDAPYASGYIVEGVVDQVNIANFRNILKGYVLPNTGGPGIDFYIFCGIAFMTAAALIYYPRRKKEKGVRS